MPERILWQGLRASRLGGLKFYRQYPIGGFFADFACPQAKLVVELDGASHEGRQEADADREAKLESLGFEVLRFKNGDLEVVERVLAVIKERAEARISVQTGSG